MTRYLSIFALAALAACSGDKDSGDTGATTDTTTDNGTGTSCDNSILAMWPEDGATDAYYRGAVRFTLEAEDSGASLSVTDAGGAEVAGSSSVTGTIVSWTPDAPLDPNTQYTATLSWSCDPASVSFTTSDVGSPTEVELLGMTYSLDITSGQWVEPPGVGSIIASSAGDIEILIGIDDETDTSLGFLGALGDGVGNQDMCSPSIEFPVDATFDDPYFEVVSDKLPIEVAGFLVEIEDFTLSGAFSSDGTRIEGGVLTGTIDTRPLGSLFGTSTDPNTVCDTVAVFGVSCVECSSDGEPYCLSVHVDSIVADAVDTELMVVTQDDIDLDPNCAR